MIQASQFVKRYDDFEAVKGISFSVPPGRVTALVGPNGAGKTTTIRTLCGILRPTSGQIMVADVDLAHDPVEVKRRAAYVPDDPPLFESLTVWEHLRFIASSYRLTNWESDANRWLEVFRLTEKRDALASGLSRGMRQKVAVICAYLPRPSVLLLDEPMTGLDPASIRALKDSIKLEAERGATVLVSSHLLSLVEDICDHMILMKTGEVLFCGAIDEARLQYGGEAQSLEEVFFHLTEDTSDA